MVTPEKGSIEKEKRLGISVNWKRVPAGTHRETVTVTGPYGNKVDVRLSVKKHEQPVLADINGFVEGTGYISIEAEHFTNAVNKDDVRWLRVPGLGRTLSGMITLPVTGESRKPEQDNPRLEYKMYFFNEGELDVHVYVSPTRNFYNTQGLRYGISVDDEKPQVINIHEYDTVPDWEYPPVWNRAVGENIMIRVSKHYINKPGWHTLKYWMVDPGVVLQKIVVDTGGLKPSYLGPPESFHIIKSDID